MDDDIIPAKNCFKNYLEQCINLNGIIGGNGRPINRDNINVKRFNINYDETGIRPSKKVDFVGHLWCFKKDWLYYMFSIKPYTFDTGEDIHLCLSCKVRGNIDSYISVHNSINDVCDITQNNLSCDEFSSYKYTSQELRKNIGKYFIDNYNYKALTY